MRSNGPPPITSGGGPAPRVERFVDHPPPAELTDVTLETPGIVSFVDKIKSPPFLGGKLGEPLTMSELPTNTTKLIPLSAPAQAEPDALPSWAVLLGALTLIYLVSRKG